MMPAPSLSVAPQVAAAPASNWQHAGDHWWYLRENGQVTWAWSGRTGYWYPFDSTTRKWGPVGYTTPGYPQTAVVAAE